MGFLTQHLDKSEVNLHLHCQDYFLYVPFLYIKTFHVLHLTLFPTGISRFACSQWQWFMPSRDDTV